MNNYLKEIYNKYENLYSNQTEYLDSLKSFLLSINDLIDDEIIKLNIVERLITPNKIISFNVPWITDSGKVVVNRGYRVQHNNALGVYKGGIRFTTNVNESVLKFLALEQTLKNSLTNLPLGGAKGGADFNPIGKSDFEIMRFSQSFMTELYKHLGSSIDVPAGDIGVGQLEVGYMYGMYKKLTDKHEGVFTGKNISHGGSLLRFEATGYGLAYITLSALERYFNTDFNNKDVLISGSGNVGLNAAYKVNELGGNVIAISSIDGVIYNKNGINLYLLKQLLDNKEHIKTYIEKDNTTTYYDNPKDIWQLKADIAMPCATQNELNLDDAKSLVNNNILLISEGANKPLTLDALDYFYNNKKLVIPSKAANAGGVSVSSFEMLQNATFSNLSEEEIDLLLKNVMNNIFNNIYNEASNNNDLLNLTKAANSIAFKRLKEAIKYQGI